MKPITKRTCSDALYARLRIVNRAWINAARANIGTMPASHDSYQNQARFPLSNGFGN